MRALLLLTVTLVTGACVGEDWPAFAPADPRPALDPRLGIEVARTTATFRVGSLYGAAGIILLYEEVHGAWSARRVDPSSGTIDVLPAPPLERGEAVLQIASDDTYQAAFAVARATELRVYTLDDGGWQELPAPPIAVAATPMFGASVAHHGRLYLSVDGRLLVWSGGSWSQPLPNQTPTPIRLAGYDAATQWVLREDILGTWQAVPLSASGQAGTPVAFPGSAPSSALNGDASSFQVLASGFAYQFTGGAFVTGDEISGAAYAAPGSSRVIAGTEPGELVFVEAGRRTGTALPAFQPALDCASSTTGCEPHELGFYAVRGAPTADRLAFMIIDEHDGYQVLAVRVVDVPTATSPFD